MDDDCPLLYFALKGNDPVDKEILNMEEAAEFFNVSIKTFIKLLKEEKVPARKIGREWRFSRQALVQWLSSGDSQHYSSSESETREFFDRVAPEWSSMRSGYYDENVISRLQKAGILQNDMVLVDLGAGDGYLSRAVASEVASVIAVDLSEAMLRELSKKADRQGIKNIRTILGDGCDMPLSDNSTDIVCANMFLHHIDEPITAIKEMHRILKPGGRVFLADLREHGNREFKDAMHDVWQGFSENEITGWFKKCGFTVELFENLNKKASGKKADAGVFVMMALK
ncbi:MAG: methyltransferase domain-containing protein [Clostridiaceae bacterium]|nr:methyltransferase domain-containing protein [Clostridiaceae bacterium]